MKETYYFELNGNILVDNWENRYKFGAATIYAKFKSICPIEVREHAMDQARMSITGLEQGIQESEAQLLLEQERLRRLKASINRSIIL